MKHCYVRHAKVSLRSGIDSRCTVAPGLALLSSVGQCKEASLDALACNWGEKNMSENMSDIPEEIIAQKMKLYKRIPVRIVGLTPLLMNRLNPESLKSKSRMRMQEYSTENDAKNSAYMAEIEGKMQLYIPSEAVYSMIINTAKQYKIKRMSLSSLLAGTMRIEPEKIPLGTDQYVVDERAVVIQNQRVLKGRAKLMKWSARFEFVYDASRLPQGIEATLKEILDDAGTRMGILDYRPQHRGWFGTFAIVTFGNGKATEQLAEQQPDVTVPKKRKTPSK